MATTTYGSTYATSNGKNFIKSYITWTVTSTDTTTTFTFSAAGCHIDSGYTTNAKITVSCLGKSKTVDNTGWGGGNHSMITNGTTSWARTTSAQTKSVTCTLTLANGNKSVATVNVTVPALTSYAVTYDANGGSGAPANQTKYYGVNLPLSSTRPSKANHSFVEWNTNAAGTGTSYDPGDTYTANAALGLHAIWHLDYIAPTISGITAFRTESSSSSTVLDTGTYIYLAFDYKAGTGNGGTSYETPTCVIKIDGSQVYSGNLTIDANGEGSFVSTTGGNFGTYSADTVHSVEITLSDSYGVDTVATAQISTATYPIDLLVDNNHVYMGVMRPAASGMSLLLNGDLYVDLPDYQTAGTKDKAIYDALVALGWNSEVIV